MSVIVKGMKMPESCIDCEIKQYDDYEDDCVCPFSGVVCLSIGRQDACPLVALPDKHGRLVDADALFREMEKAQWYNNADRDEIAEELVLNAPTIEPRCEVCEAFNKTGLLIPQPERKKGKWIYGESETGNDGYYCSKCGNFVPWKYDEYDIDFIKEFLFCNKCGADMRTPVETARDIVHEAINNSVWSDTVDTAKMHKVVDDKYAEIRGDANADVES